MNQIHFSCPYCGKAIRVKAEAAGKQGVCSQCHQKVVVPQASEPWAADISQDTKQNLPPQSPTPPSPEKNKNGFFFTGWGVLTIVGSIFIFMVLINTCSVEQGTDTTVEQGTHTGSDSISSDKVGAWVMAQQFVTDKLIAPSTASYGGLFSGDYQDPYSIVTYLGGGKYRVRAWVDSQNSFGAQIRTRFTCELEDRGGGSWRCTSVTFHQ